MNRFGYTRNRSRKEIDLRKELDNFLFGSAQEIAKAQYVLVRKIKKDDQGRKLSCVCNRNGEGSKTPSCSECLGEGYYWSESWAPAFKYSVGSESAHARRIMLEHGGSVKSELTRFFFRYPIDLSVDDRVVELDSDSEGNAIKPYRRKNIWMIQELEEKRSDQGRLEFVVAYCSKLNHVHTDFSRR